MSARSTALQLPEPDHCDVRSGATVWMGGVHTMGPMLVVPGRTFDAGQLDVARAHAAAILAACDEMAAR